MVLIADGKRFESLEINIYVSPNVKFENAEVRDGFYISPKGCELINVKNCSLSANRCGAVK